MAGSEFDTQPLIVAEVGNVTDGSLGECHAYIDALADAGADAVKFQCHIAAAESSDDERFPARFSYHPQDKTRRDYWRRLEFTRSQWMELCAHCHERRMLFCASPFSVQAVETIAAFTDWWKVSAGQAHNGDVLTAIAGQLAHRTIPVVVSTGMLTSGDWAWVSRHLPNARFVSCVTEYPTPPEHVPLECPFGLSDHSGTIWPGIVAAWEGASYIEVHVCWDSRQFHPDVQASVTVGDFRRMVEGIRFVWRMMSPDDKDTIVRRLEDVEAYRVGKW